MLEKIFKLQLFGLSWIERSLIVKQHFSVLYFFKKFSPGERKKKYLYPLGTMHYVNNFARKNKFLNLIQSIYPYALS